MTDLSTIVPTVQRIAAPPGDFDTYYPNATNTAMAGLVADAVGEAMLDGFLQANKNVLDPVALTVTPDLTSGEQALVALYAGARMVSARIQNLKTRTVYKAGPVSAESDQAATVLVKILDDFQRRKQWFVLQAQKQGLARAFDMVDMYVSKSIGWSSPDIDYLTNPNILNAGFPSDNWNAGWH